MTSLSLQACLTHLLSPSAAITVDPRGFKSALESLINFLIEHQVSATLWLKLPKDDAWWQDVWRYGQRAAGCSLYTLGEQTGDPPDHLAACLRPLPIEPEGDLKREYLCLVIADDFVGFLLAARVPSSQLVGDSAPDEASDKASDKATDKRLLKLYCSTSGAAVGALGSGLKKILEAAAPSQPQANDADPSCPRPTADYPRPFQAGDTGHQASMATQAVLSQWARCFPAALLGPQPRPLADAFLSWQLQFQEELRSQLISHRSSSKTHPAEEWDNLSTDFLAKASQELQAPLTTIKTALTLLGSPSLKLAQRQRYLEMIATQCDRQKTLITRVMDLLEIHAGSPPDYKALTLADIIPGIVSTYQPIAEEKGLMLAYTVPPNLPAVLGIEAELKQMVIHLINNGIQATPQGGRVWVAAKAHDHKFVALTVQDSGQGLPKPELEKLFDAFYRPASAQESNSSAGLELTLVQQLVHRMGGVISAESLPGQGTTFKLLLPVHPDSSEKKLLSRAETLVPPALASGLSAGGSNRPADVAAVGSHFPYP